MNFLTKTLIAAGTASVALSPIAAAAAPAANTIVRATPGDVGSSDLRGKGNRRNGEDNDGTGLIFAIIAIAVVVGVFFIARDNDNDDRPISP